MCGFCLYEPPELWELYLISGFSSTHGLVFGLAGCLALLWGLGELTEWTISAKSYCGLGDR